MFKKIKNFLKGLEKKLIIKILTVVLILLAGAAIFLLYLVYFPNLPNSTKFYDVVHIGQPISDAERQRYYHLSQGSQIMPYDWFVALEQPDNDQPFIADDNMTRFRFVPDPNSTNNPDRMPVGFAKDDPDPVTKVVNVGLTCSACHTAQMTYKGMGLRIDGAPGMIDFDAFLERMLLALTVTARPSPLDYLFPNRNSKFTRFARRVLGDKYSTDAAKELKQQVRNYLASKIAIKFEELQSNRSRGEAATRAGFGRIDALGAGGNQLYRMLSTANLRTLNAPVKALPLWYTHDYSWVQTDGSIRQPMARNNIEALAVNASLIFGESFPKNDWYISSTRLNNMFDIETTLSKFKSPDWPEDILGKIDQEKVARGEALYKRYCAACHAPQRENKPEVDDPVAVRNNKTFFVLRLFPIDKVKTDPMDAKNFAERTLDASGIGLSKNEPGATIIAMVLNGIINRRYTELNLTQSQQDAWNGDRANLLRACEAYPARPLMGAWANSPYLHNGSVPNLYQLLLPPDQRDKVFYTGNPEFDPVNVGYATKEFDGGFKFDTSITGNSNSGHEYGTTLSHDERMDLIEFLKYFRASPFDNVELVEPQSECPK